MQEIDGLLDKKEEICHFLMTYLFENVNMYSIIIQPADRGVPE